MPTSLAMPTSAVHVFAWTCTSRTESASKPSSACQVVTSAESYAVPGAGLRDQGGSRRLELLLSKQNGMIDRSHQQPWVVHGPDCVENTVFCFCVVIHLPRTPRLTDSACWNVFRFPAFECEGSVECVYAHITTPQRLL